MKHNIEAMDAPGSFAAEAEFVTGEDLTQPLNEKGLVPLQSEEGNAHGLVGCMTCRKRNIKCDEQHPSCEFLLWPCLPLTMAFVSLFPN